MILVCSWLALCDAGEQVAATPAVDAQPIAEANAKGQYLMEGWLHGREQLQWADFEIEGVIQQFEGTESVQIKFKQTSLISPDVERHRSKWGDNIEAVWLEYPDRIVEWCYGGGIAAVIAITTPEKRNKTEARLIDPRLVSLFGNMSIPDTRPTFRSAALGMNYIGEISEIKTAGDGLQTVTWKQKIESFSGAKYRKKFQFSISEKQGFSVHTSELFEETSQGREVSMRTVTQWNEMNSVWVPTRVESTSFDSSLKPEKMSLLKIKWNSVNLDIDKKEFDVATFGAMDMKSIVDYRESSDGITVSRIGNCAPDGGPLPPPPPPVPPPQVSFGRKLFLILNAVGLVSVAVIYVIQWRRGKGESS